MKIIKKQIVMIITDDDETYILGEVFGPEEDNVIIMDIVFRRDGILGVNKGGDEAHYAIVLVDKSDDKKACMDYIPARTVKKVRCIDIVEGEDDKGVEVKKG